MNDDVFWDVIARVDRSQGGGFDRAMHRAVEHLASMPVDEIRAFADLLAVKLHALDTREHCRAIYRGQADPDDGDAYISADGFLYSRCAVVARGRALHDEVLVRPEAAPIGEEFEDLLYLASAAHRARTGEEWDHVSPVSSESFSNSAGWQRGPATRRGKFTGPDIPRFNRRPD